MCVLFQMPTKRAGTTAATQPASNPKRQRFSAQAVKPSLLLELVLHIDIDVERDAIFRRLSLTLTRCQQVSKEVAAFVQEARAQRGSPPSSPTTFYHHHHPSPPFTTPGHHPSPPFIATTIITTTTSTSKPPTTTTTTTTTNHQHHLPPSTTIYHHLPRLPPSTITTNHHQLDHRPADRVNAADVD